MLSNYYNASHGTGENEATSGRVISGNKASLSPRAEAAGWQWGASRFPRGERK
jgi:hypothetical protein